MQAPLTPELDICLRLQKRDFGMLGHISIVVIGLQTERSDDKLAEVIVIWGTVFLFAPGGEVGVGRKGGRAFALSAAGNRRHRLVQAMLKNTKGELVKNARRKWNGG